MKILVDENIPLITVETLRERGHDVRDVRKSVLEGIADREMWKVCQEDGRLFITTDSGFSLHRYEHHDGILIVRLKQPNREKIHQRVMQAITHIPPNEWPGSLMIVHDHIQRIWKA